jgi:hypothetical protein
MLYAQQQQQPQQQQGVLTACRPQLPHAVAALAGPWNMELME